MKSEDENLKKEILEFLLSEEIQKIIKESDEISFDGENLIVADIVGYLQASGRTSRLYAGGISKGLSLILVDDQKALNNLFRKARWFVNDINFFKEQEVDYNKVFEEIDKDRKIIKDIIEKRGFGEIKDVLKPIFIIVESPNKARTIANFFGKPIRRKVLNCEIYEIPIGEYYISITASFGHILDLVKDEGIHGVIKNSHFIPIYEPIEGKENLIKSLRLVSLEYDNIFIATDPDTEGEKIAWDLYNLINFSNKNINRMEFHEITKRAIMKALNEPRGINENLTKAQLFVE
jgi:Reverse gyrase